MLHYILGDIMNKYDVLKEYYGYDDFRGIQEECIDSILEGNDTICVMATGGGKSVTFQIPGLMLDGLTLVISPLISLMNDQVLNLKKIKVCAGTINSNTDEYEESNVIKDIKAEKLKFLYLSPERLLNPKYEKLLLEKNEKNIVLDLKKFNMLKKVIKSRIILYTINELLGNCQGIEKVNVEDMVKLCENNIGNKYLIPNKNIKILVKTKKIFFIKNA